MTAIPRNSPQFRAIPWIFHCFLFRNYSAIARNEIAQAEATIARNYAQLRAILRNEISIGNPNYIIYDTVILFYTVLYYYLYLMYQTVMYHICFMYCCLLCCIVMYWFRLLYSTVLYQPCTMNRANEQLKKRRKKSLTFRFFYRF